MPTQPRSPQPLPPLAEPSTHPFDHAALGPAGTRASALLLHGFTGSPYELSVVGTALAAQGIRSKGILLPGHGTSPAALNQIKAKDWQDAVVDAWQSLPTDKPRFIVGFSMGGLLALWLAARKPAEPCGVVLLAPALRLTNAGELAVRLAARGLWRLRPLWPKPQSGGDVEDREALSKNPTYPSIPLRGLLELDDLRSQVLPALPDVTAPVCILHGMRDRTVDPVAATMAAQHVNSAHVELYRLPRSRHVLGLDVERDLVCGRITRFAGDILAKLGI